MNFDKSYHSKGNLSVKFIKLQKSIGIFGSYARGEQTESSDVHILVDYETAPTFIMLVELRIVENFC
ncbi:MAG: nucleotidyltransferase domain-containing protein [Nostoc sp.]|uniref:nucleotidyltransferase family protein n=1 Tax=Nostoc sp. TaxID=1180 RepID=UPI002FF91312